MLIKDPKKRPTVQDMLNHKWFKVGGRDLQDKVVVTSLPRTTF